MTSRWIGTALGLAVLAATAAARAQTAGFSEPPDGRPAYVADPRAEERALEINVSNAAFDCNPRSGRAAASRVQLTRDRFGVDPALSDDEHPAFEGCAAADDLLDPGNDG